MRKTDSLKTLFAFFVILCLASCVSLPKQAFDKEASRKLKTIGVIEPVQEEEHAIVIHGHVGMAFGLIGGLAAAGDMKSRSAEFTELIKKRNAKFAQEFHDSLSGALRESGYEVKVIRPPRGDENKAVLLEKYDDLETGVDAYLDSAVAVGYASGLRSFGFEPALKVLVRLAKQGSKEVLYGEHIAYGYDLPGGGEWVLIPAEPQYTFKNYADLMANPDKSIEGIRKGIPLITKRIAEDLRK